MLAMYDRFLFSILIGVGTGEGASGDVPPKFSVRAMSTLYICPVLQIKNCAPPPNQKVLTTPLIQTLEKANFVIQSEVLNTKAG